MRRIKLTDKDKFTLSQYLLTETSYIPDELGYREDIPNYRTYEGSFYKKRFKPRGIGEKVRLFFGNVFKDCFCGNVLITGVNLSSGEISFTGIGKLKTYKRRS